MAAVIILQAGHCHRKTGVVGTRAANGFTEQDFTWVVTNRAAELLDADGFDARVILADPPPGAYAGDAFVAVHADGSANTSVGGASVGYRNNEGQALAHAWKAAYEDLGWTFGFRADNYTSALSGYYGTRRATAQWNRYACIIEAGFLTHPQESAVLQSTAGQERCAQAIRRAIGSVFRPQTPPSQEDEIVFTVDEASDYVRDAYLNIAKRPAKEKGEVDVWAHAIAADPREMWKLQARLVGEFLGAGKT